MAEDILNAIKEDVVKLSELTQNTIQSSNFEYEVELRFNIPGPVKAIGLDAFNSIMAYLKGQYPATDVSGVEKTLDQDIGRSLRMTVNEQNEFQVIQKKRMADKPFPALSLIGIKVGLATEAPVSTDPTNEVVTMYRYKDRTTFRARMFDIMLTTVVNITPPDKQEITYEVEIEFNRVSKSVTTDLTVDINRVSDLIFNIAGLAHSGGVLGRAPLTADALAPFYEVFKRPMINQVRDAVFADFRMNKDLIPAFSHIMIKHKIDGVRAQIYYVSPHPYFLLYNTDKKVFLQYDLGLNDAGDAKTYNHDFMIDGELAAVGDVTHFFAFDMGYLSQNPGDVYAPDAPKNILEDQPLIARLAKMDAFIHSIASLHIHGSMWRSIPTTIMDPDASWELIGNTLALTMTALQEENEDRETPNHPLPKGVKTDGLVMNFPEAPFSVASTISNKYFVGLKVKPKAHATIDLIVKPTGPVDGPVNPAQLNWRGGPAIGYTVHLDEEGDSSFEGAFDTRVKFEYTPYTPMFRRSIRELRGVTIVHANRIANPLIGQAYEFTITDANTIMPTTGRPRHVKFMNPNGRKQVDAVNWQFLTPIDETFMSHMYMSHVSEMLVRVAQQYDTVVLDGQRNVVNEMWPSIESYTAAAPHLVGIIAPSNDLDHRVRRGRANEQKLLMRLPRYLEVIRIVDVNEETDTVFWIDENVFMPVQMANLLRTQCIVLH